METEFINTMGYRTLQKQISELNKEDFPVEYYIKNDISNDPYKFIIDIRESNESYIFICTIPKDYPFKPPEITTKDIRFNKTRYFLRSVLVFSDWSPAMEIRSIIGNLYCIILEMLKAFSFSEITLNSIESSYTNEELHNIEKDSSKEVLYFQLNKYIIGMRTTKITIKLLGDIRFFLSTNNFKELLDKEYLNKYRYKIYKIFIKQISEGLFKEDIHIQEIAKTLTNIITLK